MKKILIAFYLLLVILVGIPILDSVIGAIRNNSTQSTDSSDKDKVHSYTEDYAEKYKKELHEIFGDYTIAYLTDMYFPEETCDCGYHSEGMEYKIWRINYKDVNGHEMTCTLTNNEIISEQQYSWMESQIEEHFRYSIVEEYYGTFQQEDDKKWNDIVCHVGERKQELISLSSMKYSEMFDRFSITVRIRLDKVQNIHGEVPESEWKTFMSDKRDYVEDQIMMRYGKNVNVQFRVYSEEEYDFGTCIVKGEKTGPMSDSEFERAAYRAYKGDNR